MTDLLVSYYNLITKNGHFPKRWLDILDVMIEKGKGMVSGKLRVISLIEEGLQHIMRTHLGDKDEDKETIENDTRFSKTNCRSRKNYSIETALLEKD